MYFFYKSSGLKPVRLAIRDNIRDPISSRSWNANTKSGQPGRERVRCEPFCRFIDQPIFNNAASTRFAFVDVH
ncbi:hypothetical protein BGP_0946 [Beggiatoa sp. PS]|nr:hypothetical protein BGP_0946 [Beggiatoa sp. PS]